MSTKVINKEKKLITSLIFTYIYLETPSVIFYLLFTPVIS